MREYIEYLYLAIALAGAGYLATHLNQMDLQQQAALMMAIVICSFMYTLRRSQRIRMQQARKEEIRKLEEDANS
ncbi:MAG: hypothetical protein NW241_07185 [Bacteroidia bacterium]|nr:hypothetical protein [Bacteroidia bacterium]